MAVQDLPSRRKPKPACLSLLWCLLAAPACLPLARAEEAAPPPRRLDINEFRVEGVTRLPVEAVEAAVYPYTGPDRTPDDVEAARTALEKAYQSEGYQTVVVQIPRQHVIDGVVTLEVIEGRVGRLRVRGARWNDPDAIKDAAPSLAEGEVPDFNAVQRDLIALNQRAGRQVTPAMRAGREPGTIDVDLNVKDELPLHGSLELNNRHSADTKPLRLNGALRYDNLWQRAHSLGFNFQIAPERLDDAKVFSGYYLARSAAHPGFGLMLQAVKQDSDVNTLGSIGVAGRGEVIGLRALFDLPGRDGFFHQAGVGVDYKHFDTDVSLDDGDGFATPITYWPFAGSYTATWLGKDGAVTQIDLGVTLHLRGLGSDPDEFDAKRAGSGGSFIYLRGEASRTQPLPGGFEAHARVQGQVSGQPLVSNEQFAGGGLGTVRGYLESEAMGDNALLGSVELRLPPLTVGEDLASLRFHVFAEGGVLTIHDPLPEQDSRFSLASVGAGASLKFRDHFNGSIDMGLPLISRSATDAGDVRFTFRLWGEF